MEIDREPEVIWKDVWMGGQINWHRYREALLLVYPPFLKDLSEAHHPRELESRWGVRFFFNMFWTTKYFEHHAVRVVALEGSLDSEGNTYPFERSLKEAQEHGILVSIDPFFSESQIIEEIRALREGYIESGDSEIKKPPPKPLRPDQNDLYIMKKFFRSSWGPNEIGRTLEAKWSRDRVWHRLETLKKFVDPERLHWDQWKASRVNPAHKSKKLK